MTLFGAVGWFGRGKRDQSVVEADLERALVAIPGVGEHVVAFRRQAKGGGLVVGHTELPDEDAYRAVLLALARALGPEAGRVTVEVTASTPEGRVMEAKDLGLFVKPSGAHILEHLDDTAV